MIFDTHSHCYWETLIPEIDAIVLRMQQNQVVKSAQIGCDIDSSGKAIDLARKFPGIFYASVGLHPETAQDNYEFKNQSQESHRVTGDTPLINSDQNVLCTTQNDEKLDTLKDLERMIQDNRDIVVAVGECGFDFHYLDGTNGGNIPIDLDNLSIHAQEQIENQKYWWIAQWNLAQKYNLPLIIHTRDARNATLEFMRTHNINRCVMHCFSEDWDFARTLLDFSDEIYFSFSGILTYKKSEKIQEAAKQIPLDRILIETDAPFLAPQVVRGQVNEPANTRYVLEKLAELRGVQVEEIEEIIYQNSIRFYDIE